LAQTQTSRQRTKLAYEIARDGSHRRLSPQEKSIWPTTPQKIWRGQDVESFPGVWYPFRTATDQEWLELRQQLGRDPLDPLRALEPILDAVAPNQELETESGEPPLDTEPPPESSSVGATPSARVAGDDGGLSPSGVEDEDGVPAPA
jgi:hypothetical protein